MVDLRWTGSRGCVRPIDDLVIDHSVVGVADDQFARESSLRMEEREPARIVERLACRQSPPVRKRYFPVPATVAVDRYHLMMLCECHGSIVDHEDPAGIRVIPQLGVATSTCRAVCVHRPPDVVGRRNYWVRYGLPP